ncbi:hypothetical protein RFI_37729, partial [Reticulomyxa filosa]
MILTKTILDEEYEMQNKVNKLQEIIESNWKTLETFDTFNCKLNTLLKENQTWLEDKWNQLKEQWCEWKSQDISIFLARVFPYNKAEIKKLCGCIQQKNIKVMDLFKKQRRHWIEAFDFVDRDRIAKIHDFFNEISTRYPRLQDIP